MLPSLQERDCCSHTSEATHRIPQSISRARRLHRCFSRKSFLGIVSVFVCAAFLMMSSSWHRYSLKSHHHHHNSLMRRLGETAAPQSSALLSPSVSNESQQQTRPDVERLRWNRNIYLPLNSAARDGFLAYERKLRKRLLKTPRLHTIWGVWSHIVLEHHRPGPLENSSDFTGRNVTADDVQKLYLPLLNVQSELARNATRVTGSDTHTFYWWCLSEVPECEFFAHVGAPVAFTKCCTEHFKLKTTLRDVLCTLSDMTPALEWFLDSGTLLSSVRDGGLTLLPWETDIDLGLVGAEPRLLNKHQVWPSPTCSRRAIDRLLGASVPRRRFFEQCAVDSATSRCKDAHYVYYVGSVAEAKFDTARVEIWPLGAASSPDGVSMLVHPTRSWLNVRQDMVLPTRRCKIWGMEAWCPRHSEEYLDHEYGGRDGWKYPKTIHWGDRNVATWRHRD